MPYCSACGEALGPPPEVLHDPDNLLQIVEGGASNPDDHHIRAEDGPKGVRMFCGVTGRVTKIEQEPKQDGSGSEPNEDSSSSEKSPVRKGEVYDLPDESSAMDILEEVIATPVFGLDDEQIEEVMSWGDIYDGQVPPDVVENLLKNLKGVSKQKSSLMRQKYEAKLNKWIQRQSHESGGPAIGVSAPTPMPQGNGPRPGPQPSPNQGGGSPEQSRRVPPHPEPGVESDGRDFDGGSDIREERKKRRIERRNDALDIAAERFADQVTQEMASDIGGFFGDMREVAHIAFKKKAQKDPDWFFEKMEKWDMDILDAVLSPSETLQEEREQQGGGPQGGFEADLDVDEVMEQMEDEEPEETEQEPTETPNTEGPQQADTDPMSASPQDEEDEISFSAEDEDEAFEQLMGDVTE